MSWETPSIPRPIRPVSRYKRAISWHSCSIISLILDTFLPWAALLVNLTAHWLQMKHGLRRAYACCWTVCGWLCLRSVSIPEGNERKLENETGASPLSEERNHPFRGTDSASILGCTCKERMPHHCSVNSNASP